MHSVASNIAVILDEAKELFKFFSKILFHIVNFALFDDETLSVLLNG